MKKKYSSIWKYFGAYLGGAFALSFFSIFQKRLLGIEEIIFHPKAFVVPILFGGFAGLFIAFFYLRLQNNKKQLQDYLDHIDNLVQILSAEKGFVYVNRAWQEALQYSAEEAQKMTISDILHPSKREECNEIFERIFAGEKVGEFETIFVAKDGSKIHIRGTCNGSHQESTQQQTRGVFRNITVAREAEEFQRLSAQIFENTKEGLLITDAQRTIISINSAFTDISGYSEDDLRGKNAREFFLLENEHEDAYANILKSVEEGKQWRGELWARKKNGTQFPVNASVSAVMSRYGTVSRYICLILDISKLKRDTLQLQKMAWYDPLTKLPNRRHFHRLLEDLIAESAKKQNGFALFFLDLNGFKKVNDQYGHAKGDQLLEAVARRLQSSLREGDAVARLGGDEFAALLNKTNEKEETRTIAQKLADKISAPYHLGTLQIEISVSIGISFFPEHKTFDDLLNSADRAMYAAKAVEGVQVKLIGEV